MEVTLNYTSKGLIHAIRTQLEQQKKEGKISGDISYKSITKCNFWTKIDEINRKHSKDNKVFHGKGFSCDNKGQNTDWTKTIVVYGSTTFKDGEWEELLEAMGLQLVKKEEPKEEVKKEETKPIEEKKEEVKKDDSKEVKDVDLATTSVLLGELKQLGVKDEVSGRLTFNAVEAGYKFSIKNEKIVVKDKQGNVISLSELVNRMEVAEMKEQSAADNKAEVKEEVEKPKTEVKEEVAVPQQPVDQNFDDLLKVQNTNPWNTQY